MKSRYSLTYHITLKFDRCLGSIAAKAPVKFLSDQTIQNTNLTTLRLCKILWWDIIYTIFFYNEMAPLWMIDGPSSSDSDPVWVMFMGHNNEIWSACLNGINTYLSQPCVILDMTDMCRLWHDTDMCHLWHNTTWFSGTTAWHSDVIKITTLVGKQAKYVYLKYHQGGVERERD